MKKYLSKSEKKRRLKRLQRVVSDFFSYSIDELHKLPCNKEIQDELIAGRSLKSGARKRQVKYVTKLLRQDEVDTLLKFVDTKKGTSLQKDEDFHELEYLRDSLIDEAVSWRKECRKTGADWEPEWGGPAVDQIEKLLPGIDLEQVKKLAWMFVSSRNRRYSRELFRLLKSSKEQLNFNQKTG